MSFLEWLPITRRNRVALLLAFAALVMFVVWNCLPNCEFAGDTEPDGIVATSLWPEEILSPVLYVQTFKAPDMDGFLAVAACMSLILNALVTLALIPFWKMLHASSFVRLPLAFVNLLGGAVIVWHLVANASEEPQPYWYAILLLMAAGMFALSAALFVFKNELALREERARPQAG
jgi:hypothetical protein